ncbi:MAG: hypothetical protein PHE17_06950 [Thiothrix sp.]|uniref:hypothetical protein n=1 Tax=Thiothrix sp. TaxID=1032 RepID=UPI00261050AD|nr:hypothetical protein [Thiothrix sp.]MDD5392740.1 hypothetical protein [Thiothrix sp.]
MTIIQKFKNEILEIEGRQDINDDTKVSRITHYACIACAGIAVQPIPFADIFILTPIQAYFSSRIAAIRGVPVSESEALDWVKEMIGLLGLGFIAQQVAIGIWKTVTWGMGGALTIPLVYALTYAIMTVADFYFSAKARNEAISDSVLKAVWRDAFKQGKRQGKVAEQDVKTAGTPLS